MGVVDKIRELFIRPEEKKKVKPVVYRTRLMPDGVYFYFPASGKWKHRIKRRFKVKHGDTLEAKAEIEAAATQDGKPVVKVVEWTGDVVVAKGGNGTWRLIPITDEEEQNVLRKMIGKPATLHILQKVINADGGYN